MDVRSARRWIWAALALQFLGYLFDVAWHGLAGPGGEPRTVSEMVRHLLTVHLPLYVGALAVLVTSAITLVTGVAFGLVPALSVGRGNTQGVLRDETRGTSEGRRTA